MYHRKNYIKTQDIVAMHQVQHLSSCQIEKLIGMSRQAIIKRLHSAGINTGKGIGGATRISFNCDFCGRPSETARSRWRKSLKHFCSQECYFASIENPGYHPWRPGQRLAKALVAQYFNLQEGHIIHHKDGDNRNNNLANLAVYRSQSEHMNHHRKGKAKPIWDGAKITRQNPTLNYCP